MKLWGTRSTPSLPLLPGPLWFGFVVPVWAPSMGQIELFSYLLRIIIISYLKLYCWVQIIHTTKEYWMNKKTNFNSNIQNHLTVYNQMSSNHSFKNKVINKLSAYKNLFIYIYIYIYIYIFAVQHNLTLAETTITILPFLLRNSFVVIITSCNPSFDLFYSFYI